MTASTDNTLRTLILAAIAAIGIAVIVSRLDPPRPGANVATAPAPTGGSQPTSTSSAPSTAASLPGQTWAVSAPGRVEPKGGEVKLVAQQPGRIIQVLAGVNDRVSAGDPLVVLDAADLLVKHTAAEAEVSVRKQERDSEPVTGVARDRRVAEDNLYAAERQLWQARADVDRVLTIRPEPATKAADLAKAREAVTQAQAKVEAARVAARKAQTASGIPLYSRIEAALSTARADVELAEIAIDRMTIRAPKSGTILQAHATVGELAAPSAEAVLMVLGDVSNLRVKAEIEERDIGKVRIGQAAVVRSDAFPDKSFNGTIAQMGQSLGPSRMGPRGPRKPTDVDVLEVTIDLEGTTTLLPGMRVDVFLKP